MVLTIPIFGAAFFVYGVKGWGGWAAGALMVLWIALAAATSMTAEPAPIPSPPQTLLQRVAKTTLFLVALGIMSYGWWLEHIHDPRETGWKSLGFFAMLFAFLLSGVIDRLSRPSRNP